MGLANVGWPHTAVQTLGDDLVVQDIVGVDMKVIFVGYNPGRASERSGHHFAGPGNYFWALLYDSGLTAQRLTADQDGLLPYWGIGITNVVSRMTLGSSDLTLDEMRRGGEALHRKLLEFLGKDIYRAYRGLSPSCQVSWGLQDLVTVPGTWDVVLPNPSRRSTLPYAHRLRYFRELAGLLQYGLVDGS